MDDALLSLPERPSRVHGVHAGCSGWVYRHWKGDFYPADLPQKRWFEFYAARLPAVEINASFYRLPLKSTFEKWRDQAPSGFRYAVKVNRFITHNKKLRGVKDEVEEFVGLVRGLGQACGPLLSQLPPSLHRDDDRLAEYLGLWPSDIAHVVEFRHASWYDEQVRMLLDQHGAGFVVHDLVGLRTPRWASGRTAYVRFHGTAGKYRGRYSEPALREWAGWLIAQRDAGRSAWAFFNNDIHGDALHDVADLLRLLGFN